MGQSFRGLPLLLFTNGYAMLRVQIQPPRDILERVVITEMNQLSQRKKLIFGWMVSYFANLPNPVSGRPLIIDMRDTALVLKDESDFDFALGLASKAESLLSACVIGTKVWDPVVGSVTDWQRTCGKFADVRGVREIGFNHARIVGQLIAYKALDFGEIQSYQAPHHISELLR